MPALTPLYTVENCKAAYQLNWSLSLFGRGSFPDPVAWLKALKSRVEADGVRILEHRVVAPNVMQFLISSTPQLSPAQIIRSVKGRMQHEIKVEQPKAFRRNYFIHSIGSVNRAILQTYVADQLGHHPMADPRVESVLQKYQTQNSDVDLSYERTTAHGRFIYNLQVVLVNAGRWREIREDRLARTHEMIRKVAAKKDHMLSRSSILADHLHLTLGGGIDESPLQIALAYMNNLAFAQGMTPVLKYGFYAGTFGEYDLAAVRRWL
jgi:REP element-mobilizing transposase RayT